LIIAHLAKYFAKTHSYRIAKGYSDGKYRRTQADIRVKWICALVKPSLMRLNVYVEYIRTQPLLLQIIFHFINGLFFQKFHYHYRWMILRVYEPLGKCTFCDSLLVDSQK